MCGKSLKVDKRLVGKMARCPACGVTVRIPASDGVALRPEATKPKATAQPLAMAPPAAAPHTPPQPIGAAPPPAAVRNTRTTRARTLIRSDKFPIYEMICGCLLLATLILPWLVTKHRVVMSWDVLSEAPTGMQITLAMLWMIGIATIIISSILRGADASLWHGIFGLTGIMLWLFQIPSSSSGSMRMSPLGTSDLGVVAVFQFLFLLGIIVTTKIRLRLPPQLAVRIVQGACSLIFLMFALVNFIDFIGEYNQMPDFIRSKTVGDFLVMIMLQLIVIAAAILAIVHAAAFQIRTDTLSRIAMGLIYGASGCTVAYVVIRPAMLTEEPAIILTMLNCLFLTIPIVFLFCSGLIGFICGLVVKMGNAPRTAAPARAPVQAPASSGGDASVQGRLRKLESLKVEGLITNEEYNAKRTEILGNL